MKTRTLLSALIVLICFGCATSKFYPEVISAYSLARQVDSVPKLTLTTHKIILRKLKEELKNVDHIIYLYSPYPEWNSKKFSGVVYDVDNKRYYYFKNSKEHPRKLSVTENYPYPNDNYYKFAIDNFRKGRIDYLKKLGKASNLSGIRTTTVIYDINLKKGTNKRYTFQDFLFMNGKPTTDVEE